MLRRHWVSLIHGGLVVTAPIKDTEEQGNRLTSGTIGNCGKNNPNRTYHERPVGASPASGQLGW